MKRAHAVYLRHTPDAILRVEVHLTDMDEAGFMRDMRTQDAVVRQLEIIGEASKGFSSRFCGKTT